MKICCFFVITISLIFPSISKTKELAKFNDWAAFAEGEGKNLACMAVSKPKKSEGFMAKIDDKIFFLKF